ncbi:hypothetical protein D9M71_618600 [compost metagenome]
MAMARLGSAMTEQQPLSTGRIQTHRHQRRDAADEPVHQHRDALLGTRQIGADQCRDFKPTEVEQGLQRIATLCAVQGQRALDHLCFMTDTRRIQPGTRPGQMHHRTIQQGTGQGAGRRGVADAHFATNEQLRAHGDGPLHAVAAGLQGTLTLSHGHRRTLGEIRRTRTDVQVTHTRQVQ